MAEDSFLPSKRGSPVWALLGRWRRGFGGLLSPLETLQSTSWEAENGTFRTPSILRFNRQSQPASLIIVLLRFTPYG